MKEREKEKNPFKVYRSRGQKINGICSWFSFGQSRFFIVADTWLRTRVFEHSFAMTNSFQKQYLFSRFQYWRSFMLHLCAISMCILVLVAASDISSSTSTCVFNNSWNQHKKYRKTYIFLKSEKIDFSKTILAYFHLCRSFIPALCWFGIKREMPGIVKKRGAMECNFIHCLKKRWIYLELSACATQEFMGFRVLRTTFSCWPSSCTCFSFNLMVL